MGVWGFLSLKVQSSKMRRGRQTVGRRLRSTSDPTVSVSDELGIRQPGPQTPQLLLYLIIREWYLEHNCKLSHVLQHCKSNFSSAEMHVLNGCKCDLLMVKKDPAHYESFADKSSRGFFLFSPSYAPRYQWGLVLMIPQYLVHVINTLKRINLYRQQSSAW